MSRVCGPVIKRPLATRMTGGLRSPFEWYFSFLKPFVDFVTDGLPTLGAEREPKICDSHDGLGDTLDCFTYILLVSNSKRELPTFHLNVQRRAYVVEQVALPRRQRARESIESATNQARR